MKKQEKTTETVESVKKEIIQLELQVKRQELKNKLEKLQQRGVCIVTIEKDGILEAINDAVKKAEEKYGTNKPSFFGSIFKTKK